MKLIPNEGHAGILTMIDGRSMNYGVIRLTQDMKTLICYTGTGLRELHRPGMSELERKNADGIIAKGEDTLIKMGFVMRVLVSEIREAS
jgi:hypothetical protein